MKTLKQLASEIGAQYVGDNCEFKGVSIDTRTLKAGELFIAVKGERVDGHTLVSQAKEKGAIACMVTHKVDCDITQLIVSDTRLALGKIAKLWREQFAMPFIAVTGSCGKTTVKEMLGSILNQTTKALVTEGNFNNDYGLPVTIAKLTNSYDYVVLEAGSNHLGEIKYLADIIQPDVALITNVDRAHLEGFGSLEGVMKEKGALLESLNTDGFAVINRDDARINNFAKSLEMRKVYFSQCDINADVFLASEPLIKDGYLCFDVSVKNKLWSVELALWGRYQVKNALAAIAVCYVLGVEKSSVLAGLKQLKHVKGRFMPIPLSKRIQLIDDTYNASVPSVKAAIETLSQFSGKRIFVMGHMGELGENANLYHKKMGQWLFDNKIDEIYLYGDYGLLSNTINVVPNARYYNDKAKLIADLKKSLKKEEQTYVLVKGSRATEMEHIIKDLVNA
ncbi:UDP-N-acetylmuramoyl-tripeptide--D-alanyl-D-alanine ligase [Thiotrichales bacterium 19S3-7]|nr:UDP-N-acetylmuramoyl-tripeptide--D-alanyl-D-alanine ligase [Thiotrichales bacterium 19S3-7]MCF6802454.1 UDP-N-acetylmuramoyl-tripeptide--D-alanyl-D-alanine ligase [Thiotrichales bacterium 19S3-11]